MLDYFSPDQWRRLFGDHRFTRLVPVFNRLTGRTDFVAVDASGEPESGDLVLTYTAGVPDVRLYTPELEHVAEVLGVATSFHLPLRSPI